MKYLFVVILLALAAFLAYSPQQLISPVQTKIVPKIEEKVQIVSEIKDTVAPLPTVITPLGLPDYHLIYTAFVPQSPEKDWAEPWQDSCEEAALLTVSYYYQKADPTMTQVKNDLLGIFSYEQSQGWGSDIHLSEMSKVASDYLKLTPKILKDPSVMDIKKELSQDIPVIIPANGKLLFKENRHFTNGGPYYHNLVILGFDDRRKQFIVHDVGTQFGAYFHYSYDLLIDSIHDLPANGDKTQISDGSKQALILLK